jgi:hypothetical protein
MLIPEKRPDYGIILNKKIDFMEKIDLNETGKRKV